ncbi:MAG: hypothetical protein WC869_07490 [Phycisphaerae bacterium]|jgi:hypothetical protein
MLKLVVRFLDGRTLRGHTLCFDISTHNFILNPVGGGPKDAVVVDFSEVKAVFFVRDFAGNPDRDKKIVDRSHQPYSGREIAVTFTDGETLVGFTPNYNRTLSGFFLFPADRLSNATKVYVRASALTKVVLK